MPKSSYIESNNEAFVAQLLTFKNEIGSYAASLGVSAAQVTAQANDAAYLAYVTACRHVLRNAAQEWTEWKDLVRAGGETPATVAPAAPVFPAAVAAVAPGVEVRFRALVKQIKSHANYNAAIGEALGVEGPEQSAPDFATLRPVIGASLIGGQAQVSWGWGGHRAFLDAIELQVNRGDGKYVLLAEDTTPGYTDTTPLPAVAARWTYRGIYRVGDARVGQWSQEASLVVGG